MSAELPCDVWVPIPLRWRHVREDDLIVGGGARTFLVLQSRATPGGWALTIHGQSKPYTGDPDETAQVLVPVPERDAMVLLRDQLGARIADRRTVADEQATGERAA